MTLSYNGSKSLAKVCCDLPDCNNCIQGGDFVRLACFHTFHISCLPSDHCCTICKEPLKQLIEAKINHFNEGLLKNAKVESDDDSSDSETDDDTALQRSTMKQIVQMRSSTTPLEFGSRK